MSQDAAIAKLDGDGPYVDPSLAREMRVANDLYQSHPVRRLSFRRRRSG
jgi:hypothetical protein